MPFFTKESLETLKNRIQIVDALSPYLDLKRAGAAYKALCPFHEERTPSFLIQTGNNHYHCFGCGAHGDAISFYMSHLKMNFNDAVEALAERFSVSLTYEAFSKEAKGPNKTRIKQALQVAADLYHFYLLHSAEGEEALKYLAQRKIDLSFIIHFKFGLAPKNSGILRKVCYAKSFNDELLIEAGLLSKNEEGKTREFFYDRIMIPIQDASGAVIGFTARKYKEETTGGKYINTPETLLFKKSKVLFGIHHSRRRIAKEREAIIVEGQIDALRLIQKGFNLTVAGQGTAFGEGHVKELINLGVHKVTLCLDPDEAGKEATFKIGDLFQKTGIEVKVINLPKGYDPDSFLKEKGTESFINLLEQSQDYLPFAIEHLSKTINISSPAGKNELIRQLSGQIRNWDNPVMIHESLRQLSLLTSTPENILGVGQDYLHTTIVRKSGSIGILDSIDPDRILEGDLVRWMLLCGETHSHLIELVSLNIQEHFFKTPPLRVLFNAYILAYKERKPRDLLSFAIQVHDEEAQQLIAELLQKKVKRDRVEIHLKETIQKLLERHWMEICEEYRIKINNNLLSDEESLSLIKEFNLCKKNPPKIKEVTFNE